MANLIYSSLCENANVFNGYVGWGQQSLDNIGSWCADYFSPAVDPLGGGNKGLHFVVDGREQGCADEADGWKHRAEVFPLDGSGNKVVIVPGFTYWYGYRLYIPSATQQSCYVALRQQGHNISHHSLKYRDHVLYLSGGNTSNDIRLRILFRVNYASQRSSSDINIAGAFDRWITIVVAYRTSLSANGRCAVWVDGTSRVDVSGHQTVSAVGSGYTKLGMYWGPTFPPEPSDRQCLFHMYLDDYKIARALNSEPDSNGYDLVNPGTSTPTLVAPTIDPPGGDFYPTQIVSLSSVEVPDEMHYRTDGVDPTIADAAYSVTGPFTLSASADVRAIAVKSGYNNSGVAQETFTLVSSSTLLPPIIDPPGGEFFPTEEISFSSPASPDQYYYTLDGSTPTTGSTPYNATPFTIDQTTTVKVIAVKSGWTTSSPAEALFIRLDEDPEPLAPTKPTGLIFID